MSMFSVFCFVDKTIAALCDCAGLTQGQSRYCPALCLSGQEFYRAFKKHRQGLIESCSTLSFFFFVYVREKCDSLINASLSMNLFALNSSEQLCMQCPATRPAKSAERQRQARRGKAGDFLFSICPPPQCGLVQKHSLWTAL